MDNSVQFTFKTMPEALNIKSKLVEVEIMLGVQMEIFITCELSLIMKYAEWI